jgi:hypothetical protein
MEKQCQQKDSRQSIVCPNGGNSLGSVINYSYTTVAKHYRDVCVVGLEYAYLGYMCPHPLPKRQQGTSELPFAGCIKDYE